MDINKEGIFNLSIAVTGKKGFTHDCSTSYDPAVGVAKDDCIQWLPAKVLSDKEDLDIILRATDADGKQATCMKWEVAFGQGSADAWAPSKESPPKTKEDAMRLMQKLGWNISSHAGPSNASNNTQAARHKSIYAYLDSMTHTSHRCADKAQYWAGSYGVFKPWAFPYTGTMTPLHMDLSHALLGATGTVWSIDRTCNDFLPGGYCVGHIDGLPDPHCHTICRETWSLGPNGVASWGILDFTHHLPSPGVALVNQIGIPNGKYNDKGCGDHSHVVV
jgi:hypothetical protein